MVLLDTDLLISFLRDNNEAVKMISKLLERHMILYTTSINAAELYFGAFLSSRIQDNMEAVENLLNTIKIIPFELVHSKIYGEIRSDLQKRGEIINEMDIFIATMAIEKDLSIITRNTKHFEKIMKLKVETW
ncbi:MAG: type II toxin-antitoxin system VapC family toxin [Candidatus Thorarchaeota archaeon]